MNLEAYLPPELRAGARFTPLKGGLSGADVYRVDVGDRAYVLKLGVASVATVQRAADAGIAPAVVHVDEAQRAVLSVFVEDRSFPAFYWNPQTHAATLVALGQTIRRVHALPLPADIPAPDLRAHLAEVRRTVAHDAIDRVLAEEAPDDGAPLVLGHNDVNPGNLVHDGERILLLDWHTAAPMHPAYDLATIAMFLRMDDATCHELLAAYGGRTVDAPFAYYRRMAAALCGGVFLKIAGAAGPREGEEALPLGELYRRLRTGEVALASADGQRMFGLALLRESLAL